MPGAEVGVKGQKAPVTGVTRAAWPCRLEPSGSAQKSCPRQWEHVGRGHLLCHASSPQSVSAVCCQDSAGVASSGKPPRILPFLAQHASSQEEVTPPWSHRIQDRAHQRQDRALSSLAAPQLLARNQSLDKPFIIETRPHFLTSTSAKGRNVSMKLISQLENRWRSSCGVGKAEKQTPVRGPDL